MPAQTPEHIHGLFVEAFNGSDIEALMDLYEPDAILVTPPGQAAAGKAAVREALEAFLALAGPISLTTREILQSEDMALLHAQWSLEGMADGKPVALAGVSIEIARRGADGVWRYVIDNPFGDRMMTTD